MLDVNNFSALKIGLTSPEQIRAWSNGEVKKPETINYRTLRPEKDGLFCEKIFGPTKDWECYCGKYKRVRFKGIICERCGVEVTRAKVRRDRMGHIELAAPVSHIWYFKGVPSRMGYFLDLAPKDLEKILYFASYLITDGDHERRDEDLDMLKEELDAEVKQLKEDTEARLVTLAEELEVAEVREKAEAKIKKAAKTKAAEEPPPVEVVEEVAAEEEAKEDEGPPPEPEPVPKTASELKKEITFETNDGTERAEGLEKAFDTLRTLAVKQLISDETVYRELRVRYGDYFQGGMGAEAIKEMLETFDVDAEVESLRETIKTGKGQKKSRAVKRLKVVSAFKRSENRPEWMILDALPVIPPDLRPMVQLDGGRFATSDLNDLYRRVINRNNRLKRLLDLGAPEIIVNNEKRMLQEAVDALFDNGRRGRPVIGPGNRALKSLSDMLKGKQGRFRQNLLGKRVDYSGRSVIVIGPSLKLHQCGLPKVMALELFKPFVMKQLVDLGEAPNIKNAKRMVERGNPVVWVIIEDVIKDHPVMLNRAPTLHRLGIQAFIPILVEGKAIQIHPLVCTAFNADFDGDQMAVHLPLSVEAQSEARTLMLSVNNILSPAHGRPLAVPTQDMVLGIYSLTVAKEGAKGDGTIFTGKDEAVVAMETEEIDLQAIIKVRYKGEVLETTTGRLIFNDAFPDDQEYINIDVDKKGMNALVEECSERYDSETLAELLDRLKYLGFHYATKAAFSIGLEDIVIPPNKWEILDKPEEEVEKIKRQFRRGLITREESHQRVVNIWTKATDDVSAAMEANFDRFNSVYMMANSGARGNVKQIRQLAGMRGLVANPKGDIIDRPIKANFREGLTVLEYFISTHGARKGLADTALRTADSGYLTRRLVDVAQDLIVRSDDCGTKKGIEVSLLDIEGDPNRTLVGRVVRENLPDVETGEVVVKKGKVVRRSDLERIGRGAEQRGIAVRSVEVCAATQGVCRKCFGNSLASGHMVDIGEAVGIIAAQSIGEPGTQLTMRTFHTGGVAGEDITHGLPRIVELFEARKPKGEAIMSQVDGIIQIEESEKGKQILVTTSEGEEKAYPVSRRVRLRVKDGDKVEAGDRLTEGSLNPHDILEVKGPRDVAQYIVNEVQEVYMSQGVDIDDKHIELIVRQMMRKVTVVEAGESDLLPGQLIDRLAFEKINRELKGEGLEQASAEQVLLGITKASLATESFLSAASFQETTRVLTDAAVSGRVDPLVGLKENVIIGKLIPASTGMRKYRNIRPVYQGPEEEDIFLKLPAAQARDEDGLAESAGSGAPGDSPTPLKI